MELIVCKIKELILQQNRTAVFWTNSIMDEWYHFLLLKVQLRESGIEINMLLIISDADLKSDVMLLSCHSSLACLLLLKYW